MSAAIRLSSKLPGDREINGLDHLARDFTEVAVVCGIVWLRPTKVTEDLATGDTVPTVEVARIEAIGYIDAVPADVQRLAGQLYEECMGRDPLPFDQLIAPKHSDPEEDGPDHRDEDYDGDLLGGHQGRTDVTEDVHVYADSADDIQED